MAEQEGAECGHASLPLAWCSEDHRLVRTVHVDEHGDVVVAALGGRLVQPDRAHRAEIKPTHSAGHVMLEDAPQPLIGDAHEARRRRHRHLAHQDQRRLLEQQRKSAARPRPRHRYPLDPMIRAIHPRHPRRYQAMVLEKVQMPPREALEVMRLAGSTAIRTGEQRAPIGHHLQMQLMRLLRRVQSAWCAAIRASSARLAGTTDSCLRL